MATGLLTTCASASSRAPERKGVFSTCQGAPGPSPLGTRESKNPMARQRRLPHRRWPGKARTPWRASAGCPTAGGQGKQEPHGAPAPAAPPQVARESKNPMARQRRLPHRRWPGKARTPWRASAGCPTAGGEGKRKRLEACDGDPMTGPYFSGVDSDLHSDPACLRCASRLQRVRILIHSQRARPEQRPADGTAQSWNQQENPKLLERQSAHEHRRSKAARRVHAGAGNVDAEQVNGGEREPDDQAGKPVGAAFCVEPRITTTNSSVAKNSYVMAAVRL
jgi:hypothetical protein